MEIVGHLAFGYLACAGPALAKRRPVDIEAALLPALIGALTPDLIDKPLVALEVFSSSRALGHSLLLLGGGWVIWRLLRSRGSGISGIAWWWTVGIASHFAGDLFNDVIRGLEGRGYLVTVWFDWPLSMQELLKLDYSLGAEVRVHPTLSSFQIGVFALTLAVMIASRRYVDGESL